MKSAKYLLITSIVLFCGCNAYCAKEKGINEKITLITREIPLVKFNKSIRADATVSPDNRRIVYAEHDSPSERRVVINEVPGKQYEFLHAGGGFLFSPDGKRLAYKAGRY